MVRVHRATSTEHWAAAGNGFTNAGQRRRTLSLDGAVVMERLLEPANRQ